MAASQFFLEKLQGMAGGAHGLVKIKKAHIASPADNTETATGIVLPSKCMVLDCFIDVKTVDATETVDIGTDGDGSNNPDGFLDGVSLATAGIVQGRNTITTGSNEKYFSATTIGGLLQTFIAGSDVAGDVGTIDRFYDLTSGGEAVTYTTSSGTDTAVFDVYVVYIEL